MDEEKATELNVRKNKKVVKYGKPSMIRSTKPPMKKKEVKLTIDQETIDNNKYLGNLEELVAQAEAKKNGEYS